MVQSHPILEFYYSSHRDEEAVGGRGIPGRNAWQPVKGDAPVQSKRAMERRAATRHHPTRTLTKPRRDLTTHGKLAWHW